MLVMGIAGFTTRRGIDDNAVAEAHASFYSVVKTQLSLEMKSSNLGSG